MGLLAVLPLYAGDRHGTCGRHDIRQAPPDIRKRRSRAFASLITASIFCVFLVLPSSAQDRIRLALWSVELERRGPGLLLGDIRDGKDADLLAARDAIQEIDADILLLTGVDTDYDGLTATALAAFINAGYDFTFTEIGNTGVPSGFDLDRDGRFGEPEDALSFGRFRGEGGMALLSRHPIDRSAVTSFTDMRWIDVPDTRIPRDYFTETEIKNLTVSSRGPLDRTSPDR